ncbi:MAG: efflux RND transporter permease subunit, partial [Planctomycetota bacterium]
RLQPRELESYTRIGFGPAAGEAAGSRGPAVTLAVAKQKGSDATRVAREVIAEAERLRREVLPDGVELVVTRNYGETADRKVNDLLGSIGFALASVVGLLLVFLGWREALVVALAVPMSFSLALLVNELLGYTINRVTLFALILSLGLVVDDPITNVDNIQRHISRRDRKPFEAVLRAVSEVLPPVIMSTLTIIVSFLPMNFITGMMGPYMAPMAANVPLAVSFSTLAALTVVPWLAYVLLRHLGCGDDGPVEACDPTAPFLRRFYRALVTPWIKSRFRAWLLLAMVGVLFVGSLSLAALGKVPLKMLPYDNKDELQVMIDLPEGSTLERTDAAARAFEDFLLAQPEVVDIETFVGVPSPMDFNGLVRHTYLRRSPELADIRVNLLPKDRRHEQSHAIALRLRSGLERLAAEQGVVMRLVEVPPGPPVLATVVAEVYGPEEAAPEELIAVGRRLRELMAEEQGLRDLDVLAADPHDRLHYSLDRLQAGQHGIDDAAVGRLLATAVAGAEVASLRAPAERQPLPVRVRLPRVQRTGAAELGALAVRSRDGALIDLDEIGSFARVPADPVIYHKNLKRVVYVTGEMAGRPPAEAILSLQSRLAADPLPAGYRVEWAGEGEWEITVRVFRDLGLAFGAAMVFIYLLLVVETVSLVLPLLVMMAIPLTAIGIMPGFWLLNRLFAGEVGGYQDSVFFTATAMIGMIALGGIVVRNSLVLIEFIRDARAEGMGLREAIFESGAVRIRPILLTAGTTALGAWPITLDPIFSGLAWALIFGLVASTLFTLVVVPATWYLLETRKNGA